MTLPEPYYTDGQVTLYHGDATELLPLLEQAADLVVTDPPYGISYQPPNHDPVLGDHSTELAAWLVHAWHPRPLVIFGANHYVTDLPEAGCWSVWDKRVHLSADRMWGAPFELLWANGPDTAGRFYRVQHGGVVNADRPGKNRTRVHPTQKPTVLLRQVLEHTPPGVVLDPFAGSGSTLRAAKDLGRQAIGIELDERHCAAAADLLAQQVLPIFLTTPPPTTQGALEI